jgi:microcompartment protein CcmK/EutM
MQLAQVIGHVVATRKDESLSGLTLLVVQPITADREAAGRPLVAADAVGAGVGEYVFFVRGKEASFPFYPGQPPVDAGIVGIVDHWHTEGIE